MKYGLKRGRRPRRMRAAAIGVKREGGWRRGGGYYRPATDWRREYRW
jgi:hypothetical protein